MRRTLLLLAPLLSLPLACTHLGHGPVDPAFDPARIAADVAWLADDAREGRGLATDGLAEAARYVAREFETAGLEPGEPGGSYLQSFEAPLTIGVSSAELRVEGVPLARGRDFEALLTSRSGASEGEPVLVGYGISDEESGWDDYAGVDVDGRLVVVLDDRPQLEAGPLGGLRGGRFLRRAYKIATARRHGAAGILLAPAEDVEGLPANAGREDSNPTRQESEILTLAISRETAVGLVAAAGMSLEERQEQMRSSGRPASVPLSGVQVRAAAQIDRRWGTLANVVGVRPGSDPALAGEAVVIGAHLDHLGRGEYGSLAPDRRGEIHNGADDNASGTAGLLALARALGSRPAPRRSIVLVAFTAEEVGLAGSAHYVATPTVPVTDTVAMLNLDMIGRLEEGSITVFGAESSPGFESLVADERQAAELAFAEGAFAPSDQTSFHAQGVPVLFFFTGTHGDYHTPDDDAERVDAAGISTVARLVERVSRRLADADEPPEVTRSEAPGRVTGGEGGYGPYLGTVPAFGGPPVRGVRLQAVRPGSPAEQAGLRAEDVIVQFADAPVVNLEEYAALLFGSRAGERVGIVVEREGRHIETWAILGQRR
ncbi:MAG: M20/M25/M40 family metallo-hydrolase [Myxococcota bacterium]